VYLQREDTKDLFVIISYDEYALPAPSSRIVQDLLNEYRNHKMYCLEGTEEVITDKGEI
jgi:hypothetical protein